MILYNCKDEKDLQSLAVKVVCVETNEIYDSVKLGAQAKGVQSCMVSNVLHGRNHTAGGYHWRYATEEEIKNRNETLDKNQ